MSGVDVSKLTAYGVIGPKTGVTVTKVVGYVVLQPGSESGGTLNHRGYTYAQRLRQESA
jgi:hypothetical protein